VPTLSTARLADALHRSLRELCVDGRNKCAHDETWKAQRIL
jgi:hypothetical protein